MKTLIATVALAAIIALPAFGQSPPKSSRSQIVTFGDKYVGQDPDAAIRSELRRDWQLHVIGD